MQQTIIERHRLTSVNPDLPLSTAALDSLDVSALAAAAQSEAAADPAVAEQHEVQVPVVVGQPVVGLPGQRVALLRVPTILELGVRL